MPSQSHKDVKSAKPGRLTKPQIAAGAVLWFLVIVAVVAATWASFRFHSPDTDASHATASLTAGSGASSGLNLEYIVRYSDVELFSSRAGISVPETLAFLRDQGVTTIGVFEFSLWSLRKEAGYHVLSNLELAGELTFNTELAPFADFLQTTCRAQGLRLGDYLVFMPAGAWAEQVWDHLGQLSATEDPAKFRLKRFAYEDMALFLIQGARYDYLPGLALGANPAHLANVAAAGLRVSPYLSVRQIDIATSTEQALATYDGAGALLSPVLFEGGAVPGYPRYTAQTAAALNKRGLSAIIYEYNSYPTGMRELAPLLDYNLTVMIPETPIFPSELEILNSVRERYVRAIELQIRNFSPGLRGAELREEFSRQIRAMQDGLLQDYGLTPGVPQPLIPRSLPRGAYLLMGLGLAALTLLFLRIFLPISPPILLLLLLPAMAALYLLFSRSQILTGQILALWTAIVFPVYPFFTFLRGGTWTQENRPLVLWRAALQMCALFIFALAGALLLHGFLTLPPFFSGLEFFRGVKVMYILPVLIAIPAVFFTPGAREQDSLLLPGGSLGKTAFASAKRFLQHPLSLGELLLLGLLLLAALFYLTRTGHVLSIGAAESQARDFLEIALGVRPRFKEFILGYPPALLGIYLASLSIPALPGKISDFLSRLLLTTGALAPISVLNTFAHIQAPAALSILRSLHGFWLGLLCGLILILVYEITINKIIYRPAPPGRENKNNAEY